MKTLLYCVVFLCCAKICCDKIEEYCEPCHCIINHWIDLEIFPDISESDFDNYLTYHEFAEILASLHNSRLPEKYTHPIILDMRIPRQQVLELLQINEYLDYPYTIYEYITFNQLADILFYQICLFLNQPNLNRRDLLAAIPPPARPRNILINFNQRALNRWVRMDNIEIAAGISLIPANYATSSLTVRNSNLNGAIYIPASQNPPDAPVYRVLLTAYGSRINEIRAKTSLSLRLRDYSRVEMLHLGAAARIDVGSCCRIDNVVILSENIILDGNFGVVSTGISDNIIRAYGRIEKLIVNANTILIGTARIGEIIVSPGYRLEILGRDFSRQSWNYRGLLNPPQVAFRQWFDPPPVRIEPETPSPPPLPTTPPPQNSEALSEIFIDVPPPIVGEPVIRAISGTNWVGRIHWYKNGNIFRGAHFTGGGTYRAAVNITIHSDFYITETTNFWIEAFVLVNRICNFVISYSNLQFTIDYFPLNPDIIAGNLGCGLHLREKIPGREIIAVGGCWIYGNCGQGDRAANSQHPAFYAQFIV